MRITVLVLANAGGLALLAKPARAVAAGLLLGFLFPSPAAAQRDCTFRYKVSNTWSDANAVLRADSRFRRKSSPTWKKLNQALTVNAAGRDTRTSGDRLITGFATCPATMIFELRVACPAIGQFPAKNIKYMVSLETKKQDYDDFKPVYDLGDIGRECGRPR